MKLGIALLALLPATALAATSHKVARNTPLLEFTYEWPKEAAAIPALDLRLYTEAKANLAKAQKYASDDKKLAVSQKRDFDGHYYSMMWSTAGQSARLLSLEGNFEAFTGGAHPQHGSDALLWDRRLNRPIDISALFLKNSSFAAITRSSYCKALDTERRQKREGEKLGGDFDACPKYSELKIAPFDNNGNGRFDRIHFVADEYVAGPYVEGAYETPLPVTAQLIAALKPEYRSSFEAYRQ